MTTPQPDMGYAGGTDGATAVPTFEPRLVTSLYHRPTSNDGREHGGCWPNCRRSGNPRPDRTCLDVRMVLAACPLAAPLPKESCGLRYLGPLRTAQPVFLFPYCNINSVVAHGGASILVLQVLAGYSFNNTCARATFLPCFRLYS